MQPAEILAAAGVDTLARNKRQHQAFAFARLVLVLMFMALWAFLLPLGYPMPTGFIVILVAEALVLAAYRWRLKDVREERTLERLHYLLLGLELVFHTGIVYFLGGLSWLGAVAYIYALMYATVFLSWRQAVAFTAAVAVAFLTVVSLDAAALIPHQWYLPQGPERFRDPEFVVTTTVAFIGVLATVTFWMVFIGGEVRRERDEALWANGELISVQGQLRALNEELERKVEERTEALLKRAETDQLTGLLNRGAITRRFRELLALAQRGGRPLAVVLTDGDNFKACNDVGGHPHGDRILQFLARGLAEKSRETDYIGRMGGDEFLLLLPDTSAPGAVNLCRRVAEYIEKEKDRAGEGLPVPTLSFGIAVFPDCGNDADDLIRTADQAMYEAKREGGNRWRFSAGLPEEAKSESEVSGTTA
jgi:diguanylate cyclase (GGDEF)-like protein